MNNDTTIPNCFYRVSLKAIIKNNEDKILLVQEKDGRWELPGGGLDHGETITDGLQREIQEELGVAVAKINQRPLFVWEQVRVPHNDKHYFFVAFAVTLKSTDFTISEEALSTQFFTIDDIKSVKLHPNIEKLPKLLTEINT